MNEDLDFLINTAVPHLREIVFHSDGRVIAKTGGRAQSILGRATRKRRNQHVWSITVSHGRVWIEQARRSRDSLSMDGNIQITMSRISKDVYRTPTGELVAVGGHEQAPHGATLWTGYDYDRQCWIYEGERDTRTLEQLRASIAQKTPCTI